jgi:hypothetical protein
MTAPSSFSASAPIKSLGLRPGDTLIVYEVDNDVVKIALNRPTTPCVSAQLARDFAQRWTGQFPVPANAGDARLEHIVAKHVK